MQRVGKGAGIKQVEQGSGVFKKISFKRPHSVLEQQTTATRRQKDLGRVSEHGNFPAFHAIMTLLGQAQIKLRPADAEDAREF